jgi:hypothetical protein
LNGRLLSPEDATRIIGRKSGGRMSCNRKAELRSTRSGRTRLTMRGGHLTGSPRRLGNSRYLCAQRTAGVDGVKALTLREAPEPCPRGTGRFAGAHKTGKRIGRDTSTRLPMMSFSRLIANALRCESLRLQNSAESLD